MVNSNCFPPLTRVNTDGERVSTNINTSRLDNKLLTPIGPIAVAVNGTMIYNYVEKNSELNNRNTDGDFTSISDAVRNMAWSVPE